MLSNHYSSAPVPFVVSTGPEHLLGLLTVSQNFRRNELLIVKNKTSFLIKARLQEVQ